MARRREREQKYSVKISLQAWNITRAGSALTLEVVGADGLLIGTAEIGQGSFGWKSAKAKRGFKRVGWQRFAEGVPKVYRRSRSNFRANA